MFLATGPAAPPLGAGVDCLVVQQGVFVSSLESTARMFTPRIFIIKFPISSNIQLTQIGSVSSERILCDVPLGFLLLQV